MRSQSDSEPTDFAKPSLGRGKEQGEQHQIRRPVTAIDPEQAFKQHFERISRQFVQVGGAVDQHIVQFPVAQLVLNDRGD